MTFALQEACGFAFDMGRDFEETIDGYRFSYEGFRINRTCSHCKDEVPYGTGIVTLSGVMHGNCHYKATSALLAELRKGIND